MKLFIDCEFNGYQGALISMALVPEMGEPFYHVLNTDGVKIDPWVRENVMDRLIYNHRGDYPISRTSFAGALQKYLSQWTEVTIVADWPDDIKYFCDSLITGPGVAINTPCLNFEIRRLDINSDVPHNALSDAYAIRAVTITPRNSRVILERLSISVLQLHRSNEERKSKCPLI